MSEVVPSIDAAVAKTWPVFDGTSLYSTLLVCPGSRWTENDAGELSTRQTFAFVPPLEQAGSSPSDSTMSWALSLTFVMKVYVEYCDPLRIVSGCEKVMLKRASCTTTCALGFASKGTSACPGEWNVARTSKSMLYVPDLSASSVHSCCPWAWATRNETPFGPLIVTGWPKETGGSVLAMRS